MHTNSTRMIYKRQALIQELTGIWKHPLTIVEAPMGYGKTTAVKEFLKTSNANVFWQTLANTSADSFWRGFCRLLKPINEHCANALVELGVPADNVFMDTALELLENVDFPLKTCLVFDDYHLLTSPYIDCFIERLIKLTPPNLHIIIISRTMFGENTTELTLKGFCKVIEKSSFEFTRDEIAEYYKLCGICLTPSETTELYSYTEGWISALYLSLLNFEYERKIDRQSSLSELIEKTVYRYYPSEAKEFLLAICIFDSFTLEQAKAMWPHGNAEAHLRYLMRNNAFIKFNYYNQTYHTHNIFTTYLREQLLLQGEDRCREIQQLAGAWYASDENYIQAMECFYQACAFGELLAVFVKDNGHSVTPETKDRIIKYFSDCPEEAKKKNPTACVLYARKLFLLNEKEKYVAECQKSLDYLNTISDETTRNHLLGELELSKSFAKYNDLQGMVEHQTKAYALLNGPSRLFDHQNYFTFGTPSVLYMFYRQSGTAAQTTATLTKYMPRYCLMTTNHGAGAEYMMQAEQSFYQGDFENAAIAIHKAEFPARSGQQIAILLCILFLQIRLAFVNANSAAVQQRLQQMREEVEACGQYQLIHALDMCEGFIYAQLKQPKKIPVWIAEGTLQDSRLYFLSHAFFNIIYGKTLLLKGDYLKLLGLSEHFLNTASIFPNLLSKIYIHIYESIAYSCLQRRQEALDALCKSLAIAEPDQFIMPFVENGEELSLLLDELKTDEKYASFIEHIKEVHAVFLPNLTAVRTAMNEIVIPLTAREQEVAELVTAGMSNKSIGKKLFIEESTVKKTLQNIYAKLGINGRTMLTRLMLKNTN
ncbi:helix-turn-helix transcriptional regulator [Anaeroarcus burkinensis]|uniref:helix-turn-helix transcriptional regulator n=1 Tax=Anaeroarcus burkinensis TaxID=82376 RepID=UPI000424A3EC|nr:LuxR C-terminal-related transcriptional regulator [Anaeroarcus burkinensis]